MNDLEMEAQMQNYFGVVGKAARDQNNWQVIATIQTHPGGDGYVPHGYVIVKRDRSPLGEGREFATAEWVARGDLVIHFGTGHYDLTIQDAMTDFIERAGLRPIVFERER